MQYLGSKNRISRYILPAMLAQRTLGQLWVEPFVGGANMIDKVDGKRIGNDNNKYLIALLQAVQDGWIPPVTVSKEMYYNVKTNPSLYDAAIIGFVAFLCSFGGKWWGGYAFNKKGDNYAARGSRALVRQAENFKGVKFICGSYLNMEIPTKSLIYCDPPYEGTTGYKNGFNHNIFWQWCRDRTKEGHTVFISEYNAPVDFMCIKSIEHKTKLDKNSQYKRIEKLFVYNA